MLDKEVEKDRCHYNQLVELIAACYESEEFHLLESLNKKISTSSIEKAGETRFIVLTILLEKA